MLYYKDTEHKKRFLNLVNSRSGATIDPEYAAPYYLLTGNTSVWNKVKEYVTKDGIYIWSTFENCIFSSRENLIVKLAANLFDGSYYNEISPLNFVTVLDSEDFKMVIQALQIRKKGNDLTYNDYFKGKLQK